MAEIKEKGHDIDIKNIIIHKIDKKQFDDNVRKTYAKKVLEIDNKEKYFIADVRKSFAKSGLTYGIFEEQNASSTFENLLGDYSNGNYDFLHFTLELMNSYERILKNDKRATGSFLVFAEYSDKSTKQNYLLVLAINNKENYLFNDDLTLSEVSSIDLSKIDLASRINLSKWQDFKNNNIDTDTYLAFRRGRKGLSLYFLDFIGCKDKTTKTAGTKRLVKAIKDYLDTKDLDKEVKDKLLDSAKSYCIDCDKSGKGAHLSDIAKLINEEDPEEFEEFASSEVYSVSELTSIDKKSVNLLTRIKYESKDRNLILEFENTLLDEKLFYDKKNNVLKIKDVPDELVKQIKNHLG